MFVCRSIRLSVDLSTDLSVCPPVDPSVGLFFGQSVDSSVIRWVHLSVNKNHMFKMDFLLNEGLNFKTN